MGPGCKRTQPAAAPPAGTRRLAGGAQPEHCCAANVELYRCCTAVHTHLVPQICLELLHLVLPLEEGDHLQGQCNNAARSADAPGQQTQVQVGQQWGSSARSAPPPHTPHTPPPPPPTNSTHTHTCVVPTLASGSVKRSLTLFSPFHDSRWVLRSTKQRRGSLGPYHLRQCRAGARRHGRGRAGAGGGSAAAAHGGACRRAERLHANGKQQGEQAAASSDQRAVTSSGQLPAAHLMRSAMAPGRLSRRPWYNSSESLSK